jgi:hypothetical protein
MRTTLHLDDEAYRIAVRYAKDRKIGLGRAVSELVSRGSKARVPVRERNGLVVFDPPPGTPVITTEMVKKIMEEEGI